jgi:hypothetical protein
LATDIEDVSISVPRTTIDDVWVVADDDGTGKGQVREPDEDNNTHHAALSYLAPQVTVGSPADGSSIAAGITVLIAGHAAALPPEMGGIPASLPNRIPAVLINGTAADVVDTAGNFFARVPILPGLNMFDITALDGYGQSAGTTLTLDGTQQPGGSTQLLFDVSPSFAADYARTSFDEQNQLLYAELAIRNQGEYDADNPFYVGVRNISDPTVSLRGPAGLTPDGIPYYDFSPAVPGQSLAPAEITGHVNAVFHNPNRLPFKYELVFLAKLNAAPAFTTTPVVETSAGRPYTYDADATDPDGDTLKYSLVSGPRNVTFDTETGVITWLPVLVDLGVHSLTLRVADPRGGVAEQRYLLSVTEAPPNRPPMITSLPVTEAAVTLRGPELLVNGDFSHGNTGYTSEYSYMESGSSLERQYGVRKSTSDFEPVMVPFGDHTTGDGLMMIVNGAIDTSKTVWSTTVAVSANQVYDLSVWAATAFSRDPAFQHDPAVLRFTINGQAAGTDLALPLSSGEWCKFSTTWHSGDATSAMIRIVDLTGTAAGNDFVLDDISFKSLVGAEYEYDVDAVDPDSDPVNDSLVTGPHGMQINPDTGLTTWGPTANQVGEHPVTIQASDGRGGTDTQSFVVRVQPQPGNHPPVIVSEPVTSFSVGNYDDLVFGVKSKAADPFASMPPSRLFSFHADGSRLEDHGDILLAGTLIDVDGLARSPLYGLLAFKLDHEGSPPTGSQVIGSTLISIAPDSATASTVGPTLDRNIRGAAFDLTDRLWVLDAKNDSLLRANPTTGEAVTGSEVTLTVNGARFDVNDGTDVAFAPDGSLYLTSQYTVYQLDYLTGQLQFVYTDPNYWLAGAVIDGEGQLIAYEVNGDDDLLRYNLFLGATSRTWLFSQVLPTFNAGRGDLAAFPTSGYVYDVDAVDHDNDTLTYSLLSGPTDMTIDRDTGRIAWIPTGANAGTPQAIVIGVSDGRGGADTQSFSLTVTQRGEGAISGRLFSTVDDNGEQYGTVYFNDFESPTPNSEWSNARVSTGPYNGERHLGRFSNQTTRLSIAGLPDHERVLLTFDLYIIASWDGNGGSGNPGPDRLAIQVVGSPTLVDSTFSGISSESDRRGLRQSYPGSYLSQYRCGTGQIAWVPFNYPYQWGGTAGASLYPMSFELEHSSESIEVVFRAWGLQGIDDESWGIDNIRLSVPGRPGLENWTVYLDQNQNGRRDSGERFAVTDENGEYAFTGLPPAQYVVAQELKRGYTQTVPESKTHVVPLAVGQVVTGKDFGNSVVVGANQSPEFTSDPPQTTNVDQLVRYPAVAVDPNNDPLTFDLPLAPDGMTVHPERGVVVWQPTREQAGTHQVVLRVQDGQGGVDIQSFTITVVPPSPAVANLPYVYQVSAQDADAGDVVTFRLQDPLVGMEIDSDTGRFTWTPAADQIGSRAVTIVASDGHPDGEARQTFALEVVATAPNDPPVITSTPRSRARVGQPYVYLADASDPNGDQLSYHLDTAPAGMMIEASTGVVTWTPASQLQGTSQDVTVRVDDGRGGVDTQAFSLQVVSQDTNSAPAVVSTPPLTGIVGRTYTYNAAAADPEGDPVVWSLDAAPAGMSIDPLRGTIRWTPAADQPGAQAVIVRVQDVFFAAATQSFAINVRAVNSPPTITSSPIVQANPGELYVYAPRASDPDGDPLRFRLSVKPDGMTIDETTGLVRWTPSPAQNGTHTVRIVVDDGQGGIDSQSYTLSIRQQPANRPPLITSTPVYNAGLGRPYQYTVTATDPEAQAIAFSLEQKPDGMAIEQATGVVTWTPDAVPADPPTVIVVATDPAGAKGKQTFILTVRPNQAPQITQPPDRSILAGASYRYDIRASDPDGDPVAFQLDSGPDGLTMDAHGRIAWTPAPLHPGGVEKRCQEPFLGHRAKNGRGGIEDIPLFGTALSAPAGRRRDGRGAGARECSAGERAQDDRDVRLLAFESYGTLCRTRRVPRDQPVVERSETTGDHRPRVPRTPAGCQAAHLRARRMPLAPRCRFAPEDTTVWHPSGMRLGLSILDSGGRRCA